jgi:hypothetical protein
MGAHLVSQALARWTHVSDRAFRVLIRMAVTALDNPSKGRPAAVYLGGRDLLAMTLRTEKSTPRTRNRAVQRALAELSEAGAIKHVRGGWAGQNAVYRLTLDGVRSIDEHPSGPERKGGPTSHPKGGLKSHPMGGRSGTKRVAPEATPRNQEELLDERGEEEVVDVRPAVTVARATEADSKPHPDSPPKPTHCVHGLKIRHRPDGRPSCALCRIAETRPGVAMPIPDDHLALVIPLRTEAM